MRFLPLIWAGLWRHRLRSLLTFLSILVAFLLFGLLQGVNAAIGFGIDSAHLDRLYVMSLISMTESLPLAYEPELAAMPGVRDVAYAQWFGGWYQDPKNFVPAFAVDPVKYLPLFPEILLPAAQLDAMAHNRTGAIVGRALAAKYGWKLGDRVPLHSTIWVKTDGSADWSFDIVGFFDYPEDPDRANAFFLNFAYFDEARIRDRGKVGWFLAHLADPHRSAALSGAIDRLFANSPDETKTQDEKEFRQSFMKQIGDIGFIANAILGAVFFTLLFLTGNTMMQSVRERIPELAVLKALGFSDRLVLGLVLAESFLLCLAGAGAGLGCAAFAFPLLKNYIGTARLAPSVFISGAGAALLLAFLTGLPPAWRARRLSVTEALSGR